MKYKTLAPIYDQIMIHVDYGKWFHLIQKLLKKYDEAKKIHFLELGAGTGILGNMLQHYGHEYTGLDLSFYMCRQASKKDCSILCANALSLPFRKNFSWIIFLYDGMNYLQSIKEYQSLFHQVYQTLEPGGFFLFDITTETNSICNFYDVVEAEDFGDSSYIRHSYFNRKNMTQCNDFTIYTAISQGSDLFKKSSEHHCQKIYSPAEIRKAIPDQLFTIEGIWDNFTFDVYSKNSERIHFLLKKVSH